MQSATLELAVASQEHARELQEELRDVLLSAGARTIDEVLSSIARGDVVVVERVEIDAGTLRREHLAEDLAAALRKGLEEALAREIGASVPYSTDQARHPLTLSPAISHLEILREFLATGRMPWWVTGSEALDPEQILLHALEASPQAVVALLKAQSPNILSRRMARQFSRGEVGRIIALLCGTKHAAAINETIDNWIDLLPHTAPLTAREAETLVVELAFAAILANEDAAPVEISQAMFRALLESEHLRIDASVFPRVSQSPELRAIALKLGLRARSQSPLSDSPHHIATELTETHEENAKELPDDSTVDASRSSSSKRSCDANVPVTLTAGGTAEFSVIAKEIQEETPFGDGARSHTSAPSTHAQTDPTSGACNQGCAPLQTRPINEAQGSDAAEINETAHYINNAGLVLLSPFLLRLLEAVGLVENRCFRSPAAQERAVLLLQYLVAGDCAPPEHLLVLNKVLCDWPISDPVFRRLEPTAVEQAECLDLLASVIKHWKALKGTSVEGLRTAFLRREGRLTHEGARWRLIVERAGYDVLLDTLPWSMGVVVLPWMEPLYVEW